MCLPTGLGRRIGLLLAAVASLPWPAVAEPAATGLRIGDDASKTRFVLDLSAPLSYRVFTLADPYRVVIDLPEVTWKLGAVAARSRVITDFRYGLFEAGTSRIVLDLNAPVRIAKSFLLKPIGPHGHRLVVDLKTVDRETFLRERAARATRAREPAETVQKPRRPRGAKIVVAVDPGHGGIDPGTIGASGSREKRVVLAHARELRRQLRATGRYQVIMTRNRDVFVPLRKRIDIARAAGADLFVSLHADSIDDRRFRGASIYTLSETASDKETAALADKENKADVIAGVDLNGQPKQVATILIDLAQRYSKDRSVDFAELLTEELGKTTRLLRKTRRSAGFAVLKAPDVPSVLVELGYLSNRADERLLKQRKHRRRVSAAIVRAVDGYFARQHALNRP